MQKIYFRPYGLMERPDFGSQDSTTHLDKSLSFDRQGGDGGISTESIKFRLVLDEFGNPDNEDIKRDFVDRES